MATTATIMAYLMALIPTFLVPLSIGLHLISLRFLLSASLLQPAIPWASSSISML